MSGALLEHEVTGRHFKLCCFHSSSDRNSAAGKAPLFLNSVMFRNEDKVQRMLKLYPASPHHPTLSNVLPDLM